ncbi:SDR family NAD(P)-dependent oxidoreductase [Luteococcus peritonei]|uniref:SDR family NAD(P)-dependent oxidoreductase n=1 Tax=Luteococcus peritonei TaxID=88874 RepID=A0ABW4RWV8_9ACTN
MAYQTGIGQRTAVVTGCAAPRGIGLATVRRYAQEGWAVAMLDLDQTAVEKVAQEVRDESGQPVIALGCNVADPESVAAAAQAVLDSDLPSVGALAAIAGVASPASFLELSLEEWNRVMAVNLTGTFLTCQAFLPQMVEGGYGRIVTMSSVTAQHGGGVFSKTSYAAAKAGVIGLTRGIAKEFAQYGITANTVAPGAVDTDIRVGSTPEREAELAASVPLGRVAKREEVAALCVFLSSEDAGYITGTTQSINGGTYIA